MMLLISALSGITDKTAARHVNEDIVMLRSAKIKIKGFSCGLRGVIDYSMLFDTRVSPRILRENAKSYGRGLMVHVIATSTYINRVS